MRPEQEKSGWSRVRKVGKATVIPIYLSLCAGALGTGARLIEQSTLPPPSPAVSQWVEPTPPIPSPTPIETKPPVEIEKYQSTETIITHGDQTKPYIYYTVDDCSNLDTVEGFLNIAQEKGVHITFFPNGAITESDRGRELLKRMAAEGHGIGNHTYSHKELGAQVGMDAFIADAKKQDAAIKEVLPDYNLTFVRAPFGSWWKGKNDNGAALNTRIKAAFGPKAGLAGWNIDPKGWSMGKLTQKEAFAEFEKSIFGSEELTNGDIVIAHANDVPHDLNFFAQLVDKAEENGLEFASMHAGITAKA